MVWRERSLRLDGVVDALPGAHLGAARWRSCWPSGPPPRSSSRPGCWGSWASSSLTATRGSSRASTRRASWWRSCPFLLTAVLALFFQARRQPEVRRLPADGAVPRQRRRARARSTSITTSIATRACPAAPYSDMNGWGHFVAPLFWFNLYWAFAAGVLLCLAYAGWVRGHDTRLAAAVATARARLHGPCVGGGAPARAASPRPAPSSSTTRTS